MGLCHSSSSGLVGAEGDDDRICVVEDGGGIPPSGGVRRVASLYSKQGKKGLNQDSAILYQGYGAEEGVFCGVFDGHGRTGHMVSKMVRDHLPRLLLSQRNALLLSDNDSDTDSYNADSSMDSDDDPSSPEMFDEWKESCIGAFKAMDRELKQKADLDCSCSGTTAVTIIIQGNDMIVANLGDSRAVLGTLNEAGELTAVQLTNDLKPNLPHEAERIKKSNGRIFALRDEPNIHRVWLPNDNYPGLAMARAFGDFQLKKYGVIAIPQVSYRRLHSGDQFIVLATDGVWDVLSNEEVVSVVWSARRKDDAARALVAAAVRAWKRKYPLSKMDDCSVVCLSLQEMDLDDETTGGRVM